MATFASIEGGFIPNSEELQEYAMLIRELILNEDEMTRQIAKQFGMEQNAVRNKYVNKFAKKLEALADKNPSDPMAKKAKATSKFIVMLSRVFERK